MKNPNSPFNRIKRGLHARWSSEDYPGAEPRFQILLFGKDISIFILLPIFAIIVFKSCENASSAPKQARPNQQSGRSGSPLDSSKSQIIDFRAGGSGSSVAGIAKRAPGTLVKVRLLNLVETYSNAPVHAQIIDGGLGRGLIGGTLIGDAVPDTNFERINVTFRFARDPNRENIAASISARALSLDGTLGVVAKKKEGYFTRSVIGSTGTATQEVQGKIDSMSFNQLIIKALAAGFMQEFGSASQVEKNRAQVLTLQPSSEFFAELTDFFPGAAK